MKSRALFACSSFVAFACSVAIPALATAIPKPVWFENGNPLPANIRVTSSTPPSGIISVIWTNNSETFRINCEVSNMEELIAGDPGKDKVMTFAFNNCVLTSPSGGCTLNAGPTVEGLEWPSELELSGDNIVDLTRNMKFKFTIANCPQGANNAVWTVKNNVAAKMASLP